jgi:hypothetical protein
LLKFLLSAVMNSITALALFLLTPAPLALSIVSRLLRLLLVKYPLAPVSMRLDVFIRTYLIILLSSVMMVMLVLLAMLVLMALAFQVKMLYVIVMLVVLVPAIRSLEVACMMLWTVRQRQNARLVFVPRLLAVCILINLKVRPVIITYLVLPIAVWLDNVQVWMFYVNSLVREMVIVIL